MEFDLKPADAMLREAAINREIRLKSVREDLAREVPSTIVGSVAGGDYSCGISFLDLDLNLDYDKRDVFIEDFDPKLRSLGYKLAYNERVSPRSVSIIWDK